MSGTNLHTIAGNVGKDPELRFTGSGRAKLELRVATSRKYTARDGSEQESTTWHSVVLWGPPAEAVAAEVRRGSRVIVVGEVRTRSYEGRDGQKRWVTETVAQEVGVVPRIDRQPARPQPDRAPAGDGGGAADFDDDDLPF